MSNNGCDKCRAQIEDLEKDIQELKENRSNLLRQITDIGQDRDRWEGIVGRLHDKIGERDKEIAKLKEEARYWSVRAGSTQLDGYWKKESKKWETAARDLYDLVMETDSNQQMLKALKIRRRVDNER